MFKRDIDILKASLKESMGDDMDPEERAMLEPIDDVWGTLRYETHNDDETIEVGGSKVGDLYNVSFATLVKYLGMPLPRKWDDDHQANWYIEFADHQTAEIYDRHNPNRAEDTTQWRIAGKGYEVTARIDLILKGKGKRGFGKSI